MIFEDKLLSKLKKREDMRFLRRVGMTCTCPWCKQVMQRFDDTHMEDWLPNALPFDKFTCGNCGGESLWEFAPCWLFRGCLTAPPNTQPVDDAILAFYEQSI